MRSRQRPSCFRSARSRIASMLSCLASLIKEQVLTIMMSASFSSVVMAYPSRSRKPSMTSASTRFFGQPRLTMLTFSRILSFTYSPLSLYCLKLIYCNSIPRSFPFSSPITSWRSSMFLPVTRTCSSWIWACTFSFVSLITAMTSLPFSLEIPC